MAGSEKNSVEFRSEHGSNGFQTCVACAAQAAFCAVKLGHMAEFSTVSRTITTVSRTCLFRNLARGPFLCVRARELYEIRSSTYAHTLSCATHPPTHPHTHVHAPPDPNHPPTHPSIHECIHPSIISTYPPTHAQRRTFATYHLIASSLQLTLSPLPTQALGPRHPEPHR